MKTVILHGNLGKLYGRRHRLSVKTAAEAVRALVANFPTIEKYLIETTSVGYRVKLHKTTMMDAQELHHPVGGGTITITPILVGAKGIFGQLLMGIALIAFSFIPGLNVAVWSGMAATYSSIAFGIGVSMVFGGVAQMIAPMPKTGSPKERPENQPSYGFNGAVNTSAQGQPVPIGYGRLLIGGAIISAGYSAVEIAV